MSAPDWKEFWRTYRGQNEIASARDLFVEVGKTVGGEPISEAAFELSIRLVAEALHLNTDDRLLELCCGNGLMTRPLADLVAEVCAVDFAEGLVVHAREFRARPNITYHRADVVDFINEAAATGSYLPSKILLGDALGYFTPASLREILFAAQRLQKDGVAVLASGIPCDDLKWNFYNTPERVRRYGENQLKPGNANDGIGRWWTKEELAGLGRQLGLEVTLREQSPILSTFRIDALFSSARRHGGSDLP